MWKIAFGIFIKVLHFKAPWVRHLLRVQKERTSFLKPTTFDQWFWFYLNVFVKIKNSIFPQKYTKYGKIVEEKLFHFKEFYKFLSGHFFIAVIFLFINEKCYKKRPLVSKKKTIRNTKKKTRQNCLSQKDILYFRALFDRAGSFRFNCKKRYKKWKILFCTKSMRDTQKMSRNKIVYFKDIC